MEDAGSGSSGGGGGGSGGGSSGAGGAGGSGGGAGVGISVKERTQRFNKMASEVNLLQHHGRRLGDPKSKVRAH